MLEQNNQWKLAPAHDLVPFSLENIYTPKMLQQNYDKNEEDGKIYDLCELAEYDFTKIAPMIEEVEDVVSSYFRLMIDEPMLEYFANFINVGYALILDDML